MVWYVNYDIVRGLPWERLVIIKDRRSHRVVTPSTARAYIQTSTTSVLEVTTEITGENGVQLSLSGMEFHLMHVFKQMHMHWHAMQHYVRKLQ